MAELFGGNLLLFLPKFSIFDTWKIYGEKVYGI